jgi:hypothetical protein
MFTFTGGKTGSGRRLDPLEHPRGGEVDVVHGAEDVVVERVEADADPAEAGVPKCLRLLGKERAVGRQRQIEPVDL